MNIHIDNTEFSPLKDIRFVREVYEEVALYLLGQLNVVYQLVDSVQCFTGNIDICTSIFYAAQE